MPRMARGPLTISTGGRRDRAETDKETAVIHMT